MIPHSPQTLGSPPQNSPSWLFWQSTLSDYLDESLNEQQTQRALEFLELHPDEKARCNRYKQIIQAIAAQPKIPLPDGIRTKPLAPAPWKWNTKTDASRTVPWEKTPWYVRTGIEGVLIAFGILLAIAMVPRLRTLYEQSIQRRLDSFSLSELIAGSATEEDAILPESLPLARGKTSLLPGSESSGATDDFSGEDSPEASESETESTLPIDETDPKIRVGNSEVWRFNIKTDSPHSVRRKVVHLLTELGVSQATPGLGGVEAPGGIQFDLLVPQNTVGRIKVHLQKLTATLAPSSNPEKSDSLADQNLAQTFTWYKVRSKRPLPGGQSRIVIWLSQI